jgi:hypothetical protein
MLLSVKLDYNNIKYLTIHNLENSCELEISNPVMIKSLDHFIKDLTFDSFYENNNSVTIQVSGELYDQIVEYLSRYGRISNPQKWIKFNDRDIFFNTLRHFSKVGDQITEKLNLPDYSFDMIYYDDDYTGYILEMSDGCYMYKILIPWQFWDMSPKEVDAILNKIPSDKFNVKYSFFDLREITRDMKLLDE